MTAKPVPPNNPKTLALARLQLRRIARAEDERAVLFHWAWCSGWLAALQAERLIDDATFDQLNTEADQARAAWPVPPVD